LNNLVRLLTLAPLAACSAPPSSLDGNSDEPGVAASARAAVNENGSPPATVTLHNHTYTYDSSVSDEFNGWKLDTTRWLPTYRGTPRLNDEWECFSENQRYLDGRELVLVAEKKGSQHAPGSCNAPNYASGMIRSVGQRKYGYFEAAMKLPAGRGLWPAFWLIPGANAGNGYAPSWPPEIDVMEMVNNGREGPYQITQFLHGCGAELESGLLSYWGDYPSTRGPIDFADGNFHRFAVEWTESNLYLYVDGQLSRSYDFRWDMTPSWSTSLVPTWNCWAHDNGPAEIIIDLAMGGSWAGDIDDSALPAAVVVDYVRVYDY
jgi:beta-glucanase (GH16 family)